MKSDKIILSIDVLLDERYNGEKSYEGASAVRTIYESEVDEFLDYADKEFDCQAAIEILKAIVLLHDDIEHRQIKEWIIDNFTLHKKLFTFPIEYLEDGEESVNPWLRKSNIYIEGNCVVNIILFVSLYNLLYFGQYHLPIQYRAKEEVDGYYEEAQDSDETTVFEELKVLLGIS